MSKKVLKAVPQTKTEVHSIEYQEGIVFEEIITNKLIIYGEMKTKCAIFSKI